MRIPALLAMPVVLIGCVRAHEQYLTPTRYEPVPVEQVTVFLDVSELQVDTLAYERLAIIHLSGDQAFTNREQMIKKAVEKAAEIGANGVVFMGVEEGRTTYNFFTGLNTSDRQGEVVAVRWWVRTPTASEDAEPAPRAVAAPAAMGRVAEAVVVTPAVDTLMVGERVQLVARAYDSNGTHLLDMPFTWTTSDYTIASVTPAGTVTGHTAGAVVVGARTNGAAGAARVVVVPRQE